MQTFSQRFLALVAGALVLGAVATADAEPLRWFGFTELGYQQGGAATRDDVLGSSTCCGAVTKDEFTDRNSTLGAIGIGAHFAGNFFSTFSISTSSALHERYKISTKPLAPPAFLSGDAASKRDSALLLLGYRFYELGKFSAHASAGIEYSRNRISSVNVTTFILPGPPFNRSLTVKETSAAVEAGVDYQMSAKLSISAYARAFERGRSQFGARLTVLF